ncbi:hypothetical protein EC973_008749 [Apophysomyces ossiformis]|uniref:Major facilitator superfamily (MFS) profile domain-containing protein n=1 Tax=Apophysomyces ossiformis TaxID=679940 RepID=A0A8H7BMR2_9FUNG|nr:hypothetical protein EC973_008749 [Apophysomyces ossiformis]
MPIHEQSTETTGLLENERDRYGAAEATQGEESWQDLKNYIKPLVAANFMSILVGLNDGNIGVIIPRLRIHYDVNIQTVSLLFLCNAIGFLISAASNGYMVHRFGQLGAIYIGSVGVLLSYLLLMQAFPFTITCALMVLQGSGVAFLDAGMNVYTANVPMATMMLNILHALYGVGAMISPLVNSFFLAHQLSWRYMYGFLGSVAFLNLVLITVGFRNVNVDGEETTLSEGETGTVGSSSKHVSKKDAILNRMTLLCAFYILVYVGVEIIVGGWGFTFLTVGRHGNEVAMNRVMSGYWAGLALGRVVLGYVAGRFGEKATVTVLTVLTAVLLALVALVPNVAVDSAAIVLTGFVIGPMFPTTVSLVSKVLPRQWHATSIGFIAAVGASGAAVFPFVTGIIAGAVSVLAIPYICLAMTIAMQIMWIGVPSKDRIENR